MDPRELLVRCYANKYKDQWQIFCIDYCLAAQADTFEEALNKMKEMVGEYIYDATVGEDRKFAGQLLRRKAPLSQRATYHFYSLMHTIGVLKDGFHKLFRLPVPLVPIDFAHE